MKLNIRPMTESDIDRVHEIEQTAHVAPWAWEVLRDCVLVGYHCRILELDQEDNPQIIGYTISRFSERVFHILNLCIAKEFQHQGYGRVLLTSLLNSVVNSNAIDNVVLEVRPSNKIAIHLYATMGFKQKEIKRNYYNDKPVLEDAILLEKKLST